MPSLLDVNIALLIRCRFSICCQNSHLTIIMRWQKSIFLFASIR